MEGDCDAFLVKDLEMKFFWLSFCCNDYVQQNRSSHQPESSFNLITF